MKPLFKIIALLSVIPLLLSGCQLTNDQVTENNNINQRATLIDLAKAQPEVNLDKTAYTKAQRADKLAEIYQSILTLEPDPEVRIQVEYRLVQIDTQAYENLDFESLNQQQTEQALTELVNKYQGLLTRYPDRADNEVIQYQLAKTLDLQGKLDESLLVIESLLVNYPNSQYLAELNFRRGEIYYNFANYSSALHAYQQVIKTKRNEKYLLNSIYMSGWSLFKLDKLAQADVAFIQVLETIITDEKQQFYADNFSFEQLTSAQLSLADDAQRVLNISLSQQKQAASLVALLKSQKTQNLYLYHHILFKNLAEFLVEKDLKYDAELTYLAYINLAETTSPPHVLGKKTIEREYSTNSEYQHIWAARFSLDLVELYKKQGKYSAVRALKQRYVVDYGLDSVFFLSTLTPYQDEVLPHLLRFSYQHARALYAKAQKITELEAKKEAFAQTAIWLKRYLNIAKYPRAKSLLTGVTKSLLADEFLYADASFEAGKYQQALQTYHQIAYQGLSNEQSKEYDKEHKNEIKQQQLRLAAAYATTLTIRALLAEEKPKQGGKPSQQENEHYLTLLTERFMLDKRFIETYPNDNRALALATFGAEYAYETSDFTTVKNYSDFVLEHYQADTESVNKGKGLPKLTSKSLKQVQIVSQLQANILYQQKKYTKAELSYVLALRYVNFQSKARREMRELLASCIYFQGQDLQHKFNVATQEQTTLATAKLESTRQVEIDLLAEQAINHYLRIYIVVNNSKYALTGQFDAANLLLDQQLWQRAVDTLLIFKKRYPRHEYTAAIPAKLAKSYENLGKWQLAAEQLLFMANAPIISKTPTSPNSYAPEFSLELKRAAQYTAAQYYLKAGNRTKAILTYRTYAHKYPKPFDLAQEVRFKLSQLYQQSKQINKEYFWYRKVISYHDRQKLKLGNKVTESMLSRSTYLASVSALGLARAHQQSFKWAKLKIPLNKSLKTKQKSMKAAIGYYQKVLLYQLAEFVPNATYNLGEMYRQLAADVMSSQRPKDLDGLALEEYEMLLEEIAYPFEEKAIEIHASNAERTWQNIYDKWVAKSFIALAELDPVQFDKHERMQDAVLSIH